MGKLDKYYQIGGFPAESTKNITLNIKKISQNLRKDPDYQFDKLKGETYQDFVTRQANLKNDILRLKEGKTYDDFRDEADNYNIALGKNYLKNPESFNTIDLKYNIRNNQKVNKSLLTDIARAAKVSRTKTPLNTILAIAQRESGIGTDKYKGDTPVMYPDMVFSNWYGSIDPNDTKQKNIEKLKRITSYPFAEEINTIDEKTKKYGIRGYNYGDPNYPNKIAKEKEILNFPENRKIMQFADSVYKATPLGFYNKQTGGESNSVIAENKEYIKTKKGQILKIKNAPTHNDKVIQTPNGNQSARKGGILLNGIDSVLSATHDNRTRKNKLYTYKDEEIKISPADVKIFNKAFDFNVSSKKSISPAKLLDKLFEARNSKINKFKNLGKEERFSDARINSLRANKILLAQIPEDKELYDAVFEFTEGKKSENQLEPVAQTGGKLNKYYK